MATPTLPCRYDQMLSRIALIRTGSLVPTVVCEEQATHRLRVELWTPGLVTSLTGEMCVWHVELIRTGGYGLVYPATTIPGVVLTST